MTEFHGSDTRSDNRRRREILLFLLLLSVYAYFFPRWADWGQNSRFDLVLAIVEERTLSIDSYYTNTGDYAVYNGKHYSDKAPGTSFLAVPAYVAFKLLTDNPVFTGALARLGSNSAIGGTLRSGGSGLQGSKLYFNAALAFVTLITVALPAAALGVLIYRLSGRFVSSDNARLIVALVYGLGTSAFPYAQTFNSHQVVAFLLFSCFYLITTAGGAGLTAKRLLAVGFLLAYAVISEYPAAMIAGILGLHALSLLQRKRGLFWMLLGALPPMLFLGAYNYAIFGTPLRIGYSYSPLWTEAHSVGFLSLTYPKWEAFFGVLFGPYRGLFFVSPFLLLAVPGLVAFWRRSHLRAEFLVCVGAVVSFIAYNSSSAMWQGGFAVGPRYLVAMLPFLALPTVFAVQALLPRRHGKPVIALLASWSIAVVWIETISGQSFPDYTPNPLIDYSLSRLIVGDVARNVGMILDLPKWYSLMPLGAFAAGVLAALGRTGRPELAPALPLHE